MINIEYSERSVLLQRYTSLTSNRYMIVASSHYSNRTTALKYVSVRYSDRKIFMCAESPYSTRTFWMQSARLMLSTNRFCAFAGDAGSSERFCAYKVNAKILVSTASLSLAFTYFSTRTMLVNQDIIDQRTIMFCLPIYSERYAFVERVRKAYIFSSAAFSQLTYSSERVIYFQLRETYDMRYIGLLYSAYSDRETLCSTARASILYTPQTKLALNNLYSDRTISIKAEVTHSERTVMITLTPFSERYILTVLRIISERSIQMMVYTTYAMQAIPIMQARPEKSERFCMFRTIVYFDTRKIFLELRELYSTKNVSSLGSTTPIILTGTNANVSVSADRQLTVYGSLVIQQESFNTATSNKIVFTANENTYTVSMLDYTGASLTIDGPVRKKVLLSANVFYVEVNIT